MSAPSVTWWANRHSEVKHATTGGSVAVCGGVIHRGARQVGRNSWAARPCKRCMPRLTDEQLSTLRDHAVWTGGQA